MKFSTYEGDDELMKKQRQLQYDYCSLGFAAQLRILLKMGFIQDADRTLYPTAFTGIMLDRVWQSMRLEEFRKNIDEEILLK